MDHRTRLNARNPFDIDVSSYILPDQTNQIALLIEPLPADRNACGGDTREAQLEYFGSQPRRRSHAAGDRR